jgi:lysyl-tRNA synthetase, class I
MHWADKIAKDIIASQKFTPYWVDDMKTPSGYSHIGSLRGPLIHSVIFRALKDAGKEATFTFVINDFDHADEFPPEFKEELKDYAGCPLRAIPSPIKGFGSLAELLAQDLKDTLISLGFEAKFLSSWDLYHEGKFDEVIRLALDNLTKIQDIYQKISGSQKAKQGWLPFQVICEKCGKLGTTRVYAWDGKEVSYKCEEDMVTWAKGCGHEGKVSPFGGKYGKLPWKVDWAAHWKVLGVTIEGAGKDHASAGGSYDIAMEIVKEVFKYPQPFKLPYEFFLYGGKKMSSSKGLGLKAHDIVKFLPPELARFLFTRQDYREQIEFNPVGNFTIPDLFDEYDRCWKAFIAGGDENLSRTFKLSQINKLPSTTDLFLPRFRDVAINLQNKEKDLVKKFEETKGSKLTKEEIDLLKEREKYALIWLKQFAPEEFRLEMAEKAPEVELTAEQKTFLKEIIGLIEKEEDADRLQQVLYEKAKEMKMDIKKAFSAIYLVFIGKEFGPRAGQFLSSYPKEKVIERLKEVTK